MHNDIPSQYHSLQAYYTVGVAPTTQDNGDSQFTSMPGAKRDLNAAKKEKRKRKKKNSEINPPTYLLQFTVRLVEYILVCQRPSVTGVLFFRLITKTKRMG